MPLPPPIPYWTTPDQQTVRLYHGDVCEVLARLPAGSVHCCITSPPYWGLRDYGVAGQLGAEPSPDCGTRGQAQCGGCYVCAMVGVFRAVGKVLRPDGTLWLNLGDSYTSGGRATFRSPASTNKGHETAQNNLPRPDYRLAPGNLVGVPWRVALALQADGWVLRQDIIWQKPSPMPESVRDRCTRAHEYVFLLTRGKDYYCDMEAIKVDGARVVKRQRHSGAEEYRNGDQHHRTKVRLREVLMSGKTNRRDVWSVDHEAALLGWLAGRYPTMLEEFLEEAKLPPDVWRVASQGYKGAHFATFPPKLVEPMILAGTSERGACPSCGAQWRRVVDRTKLTRDRPNEYVKRTGEPGTGNSCANTVAGVAVTTVGWEPGCGCKRTTTVPCTVLDPFVGSGTTCAVAAGKGRRGWGIDLSEAYLRENAVPRVTSCLAAVPDNP